MMLSNYVSLQEATRNDTAIRLGIDNTPTPEIIERMRHVAEFVFDPCREFVGGPLGVTSFYRSKALNTAIGGSKRSQHCKGEAIDIDCDKYWRGENAELLKFIKDTLNYDQLISEFPDEIGVPSWVHVSLKFPGMGDNRRQVLRAVHAPGGRTIYEPFNLF